MVMLATVAVTGWLFIVIPKGFFPEQDTGLILGVTEAAQDVSPDGMAALQQRCIALVAEGSRGRNGRRLYRRGRSHLDREPRARLHRAEAARPAPADRPGDGAGSTRRRAAVTGVRLFMQPVQDVNIGGRLTATQYQYTLTDVDLSELNKWAPIIQSALAKLPQLTDLTSDQQSAAPQLTLAINRDVASRLGITAAQIDAVLYDAFGQRPISQLYTSLNQYFVIMEVNPGFQLGPNALQRIYVRSQTSGMVPLSELVTQHTDGGAAVGQPPGSVPVGDDQLQPEGQCAAGSGGVGDPAADGDTACAADDQRQLPGQRAGVSELAVAARRS